MDFTPDDMEAARIEPAAAKLLMLNAVRTVGDIHAIA
jgi:hypothetical protein